MAIGLAVTIGALNFASGFLQGKQAENEYKAKAEQLRQ